MAKRLTLTQRRQLAYAKQQRADDNKVYEDAQKAFMKAHSQGDASIVLCEKCGDLLSWDNRQVWHDCYATTVQYAVAHEIAYGCYPVSLWQEQSNTSAFSG